jgi:hypothetical protein
MDVEELKKLAADPRFIEGIYNYCDRWCERCSYRSRCVLYAEEEKTKGAPESDIENDAFWKRLEQIFQSTHDLLLSMMRERGINPEDLPIVPATNRRDRKDSISSELLGAAQEYQSMAQCWLDQYAEFDSSCFDNDPADGPESAIQVVQWYCFQIVVKLRRGLNGRQEFEEEQDEFAMEDANGSVKVALIGIDRSIAAWSLLDQAYLQSSEMIHEILLRLERLRRRAEAAFPSARSFQRPGFDYSPAVQ